MYSQFKEFIAYRLSPRPGVAPRTYPLLMDSLSTMKVLILVVCTFHLMVAQHPTADRSTHCESCLLTAREMEKILKDSPAASRETVLEHLLDGEVCDRPAFHNHKAGPKDTLMSSCKRLLEDHREQFSEALYNKEPKGLEITLCYERSASCVGVKRHSFENSKVMFKDSDLEALIQSHKGNMRVSQPLHTHSPSKEEL
ncbi:unnamed protein product [Boreogadus saida]